MGMGVAVLIVIFHTEHRARESEDFTESHKHGVVDFAGWRHTETCDEQTAADSDKENRGKQRNRWLVA